MLTSIALGFLTDKTYSFNKLQAYWLSVQYVYAIMWYDIDCNIIDIENQLSFAHQELVP